jgi:hypothetical protein
MTDETTKIGDVVNKDPASKSTKKEKETNEVQHTSIF